ncbi:MAG: EamA/RhaT family transporter [Burkholderiaceae bacterium]|nr:MAG: EamA/RhaT family transporter [Burkholderiaceae bacterium]
MTDVPAWLWAACTVGATAVQTLRNAMQRSLTERLGTIGATNVRFLYGLPFALLFLAVVRAITGPAPVTLDGAFPGWLLLGAIGQTMGTALMLAAMRERSFVVAIAYVKTEPVQIALFGLLFLGEALRGSALGAVIVATGGVLLMSLPARGGASGAGAAGSGGAGAGAAPGGPTAAASLRPALLGIASGAAFALSAVGFRGAVQALGDAPFYLRATVTLVWSLAVQTALVSGYMALRDRAKLVEVFRAWRPSLVAGAAGAGASQLWLLAFALQTAAAVRTVGLIEILFSMIVSRRVFAQRMSARELIGVLMMVAGVIVLLAQTA